MEASALQAPAGLTRARISVSAPLLRLRSDDQLVALFRAGHDDAFRVIHDRYRQRLFAYTRQMLPGSSQDAEDILQDVFVRAYSGLRANRRELALRPWLYRVAHNRCIDEVRRPILAPTAMVPELGAPAPDPVAQVEQREALRRLIADLRRLPTQQRSALLMRELGGMSYAEVADAMDVTVPAVKSLLVRARIGLTLAAEARDTACVTICDEIALAHDRGVRCSGTVRRHVTDCGGCRDFQSQLRRSRHQFAALTPTLGPIGVLANLLGWGGGGAAASGGATATTGALAGGGTAGAVGTLGAGASHVAALIAATVVTAGGAVAIQHSIAPSAPKHSTTPPPAATASTPSAAAAATPAANAYAASSTAPVAPSSATTATKAASKPASGQASASGHTPSISGGDDIVPTATPTGGADPSATGAAGQTTNETGATPGTTGTVATTGTTGASGTSGTSSTGTAGTTTSTGTAGSTTGTATSSTGTTDSTSSATTGSSSSTTGTSGSTTSGVGSTPPTSTGTTTGPPTGP